MKRKFISVICAAVLVMTTALMGCGNETANKQEETPVTESETVTEEVTEEVTPEPTEVVEEAPAVVYEDVDINVAALKGPTAMGMVKLMDESDKGETATNHYTFTISAAPDEITPAIVQGNLDIAAVPANLAAVLYNKTKGGVKVIAVNTLGVLYIVENGETINTVEDLRGKTIYASGKGATPEYALNYMLSANGINPDTDVTIEYKAEHAECVSALENDPDGVAMLPQPFVTTAQLQNEKTRIALDMTKEWQNAASASGSGATLITGVVIARTQFVEEHPEAVDLFLEQYGESVDFTNENIDEASTLIENYGIIKAAVAAKAIPYCNITCMAGDEMKEKLSGYLGELYNQNPESVGGELPKDEFYY